MKYLADGDRFVRSTVCHRGKYFELAARQSGVPGTISLEQIIGKRCFGEQRHKDVGRDDNKPGDSRVDGCDYFIAAGRAIEDGTRARAKRASSVLCFAPSSRATNAIRSRPARYSANSSRVGVRYIRGRFVF